MATTARDPVPPTQLQRFPNVAVQPIAFHRMVGLHAGPAPHSRLEVGIYAHTDRQYIHTYIMHVLLLLNPSARTTQSIDQVVLYRT